MGKKKSTFQYKIPKDPKEIPEALNKNPLIQIAYEEGQVAAAENSSIERRLELVRDRLKFMLEVMQTKTRWNKDLQAFLINSLDLEAIEILLISSIDLSSNKS